MTNLTENPFWETGIYQLETTDPVMGGPSGIDNFQAKQLANRTLWLKQQAARGLGSPELLLLTKTNAQSVPNGAMTLINFNSIQQDTASLVSPSVTGGTQWVVPAGYSYVRLSAGLIIDPTDGVAVNYSIGVSVNGSQAGNYATANGRSIELTGAGQSIPANIVTPIIPVNTGDLVGLVAYQSDATAAMTIANQAWMQFELFHTPAA